MIIAIGNFEVNKLIDQIILMANDLTKTHEHNKNMGGKGNFLHEDGWGVAYLKNKKWIIKKSSKAIFKCSEINQLRKIKTNVILLHARKKTVGEVSYNNCQPFHMKKKNLIFSHNGTINSNIPLKNKNNIEGNTDSEKLFHYILENNQETIIENNNKLEINSGSNTILSNLKESIITVFYKKYPKYYNMVLGKTKDLIIVSSEKFDIKDIRWYKLNNKKTIKINHSTLEIKNHSAL